jgi:hypothetical protein
LSSWARKRVTSARLSESLSATMIRYDMATSPFFLENTPNSGLMSSIFQVELAVPPLGKDLAGTIRTMECL